MGRLAAPTLSSPQAESRVAIGITSDASQHMGLESSRSLQQNRAPFWLLLFQPWINLYKAEGGHYPPPGCFPPQNPKSAHSRFASTMWAV